MNNKYYLKLVWLVVSWEIYILRSWVLFSYAHHTKYVCPPSRPLGTRALQCLARFKYEHTIIQTSFIVCFLFILIILLLLVIFKGQSYFEHFYFPECLWFVGCPCCFWSLGRFWTRIPRISMENRRSNKKITRKHAHAHTLPLLRMYYMIRIFFHPF